MSESVEILRGAVEPLGVILYVNGVLLTGASLTVTIARTSDGLLLDFADNTFKGSPGTPTHALTESPAGTYEYAWNTSTIANPVAVGVYESYAYVITDISNARVLDDASGELRVRSTDAVSRIVSVITGTASAGAANSITLTGGSVVDNSYRYAFVEITSGTGTGQTRRILDYVGSTKVATVGRAWTTTPDNTSVFALLPSAAPEIVDSGIAQAGASSSITLNATSSSVTDYYVGAEVYIASGTGAAQAPRVVTSYNGTTKVATFVSAWATTPDSTSVYLVLPFGRAVSVLSLDKTGYGLAANAVDGTSFSTAAADVVLGRAVPGSYAAGSLGAVIGSNLLAPNSALSGTASAGTINTITLTGGAATDNIYRFGLVLITAGTGAGEFGVIIAYAGATKIANMDRNWAVIPDGTSVFAVLPGAHPLIVVSGVVVAAGASTVTLVATSSAVDGFYNGDTILIRGGTGTGQANQIVSYVGATKVATLAKPWVTTPDTTSGYEVLPFGLTTTTTTLAGAVTSSSFATGAIDANAFAQVAADKVWASIARTITGTASGAITAASFAAASITSGVFTQGAADLVWSSAARTLTSGITIAAGGITTASFAGGAIDSTVFAQNAADMVWATVARTLSAGAIVAATYAAGAITAAAFAAGALDGAWDAVTSKHVLAGTFGLQVGANLDVTVGSRLAGSVYVLPLTSAQTAAAVWGALTATYVAANSFGLLLGGYAASPTAAANAAAIWNAATASFVAAGSYGLLLGTNLDTTVSSRSVLAAGAAMALTVGERTTVQGLILSDATPFQGARIAHLDADISSRASSAQATQLLAAIVAANPTAAVGSTSTVVRSTATQATGFYAGMVLVAINAAGVAARRIASYASVNGAFTLDSALPFAPALADQLYVIAALASLTAAQVENAVWDAVGASHTVGGSMGALEARLDVAVSSRAQPSDITTAVAPLATSAALTAAVSTIDGHTDAVVAPLATSANITAAQTAINTHTDADVAPLATSTGVTSAVAPLATSSALSTAQADLTAIKGVGFSGGVDDLHTLHALTAGTATGAALSAAITTIDGHTDGAVAPLATATNVTNAVTSINARTDADTSSLATSTALTTAQADLTAIKGAGFVAGTDDLHSAHALLSGAATGAALTAAVATVDAHTDASVAPLATSTALSAVQVDTTAIRGAGFTTGDDLHAIRAAVNAIPTAAAPTAAAISAQVGSDLSAAHGAGSWATAVGFATSAALAAVQTHGDATWSTATPASIWGASLPGAFGAGTAGFLLGTYLDVKTSLVPGLVWEELVTSHPTALTFGSLIGINVNATIGSRLPTASYTTPPTAAVNATTLLDLALAGHTTAGTVGAALTTASGYIFTTPPTPAAISAQVGSDLATAHGTGTWITAAGFSTPANVTASTTAVNAHIDAAVAPLATSVGVTSAVAPLATSTGLASATAALQTHGDVAWATAMGFATPSNVTLAITTIDAHTDAALASLQSHGDTTWATATGFASSSAIALVQADTTAIKGASFGAGDDLHSLHVLVTAIPTTAAPTATQTAAAVWDALVASHTTAGTFGLLLGGLSASMASAVWSTDLTSYQTYAQINLAGGSIAGLKILGFNRMNEIAGAPGTVTFYKNGGSVVYASVQIRDSNASAVTAAAGEPAQRTEAA